uniref:C-type lectin domain-containing protein n=1 Tax=Electrophorus electricus TaxID=8005 RepID=A0AAY5F222_ELEEL
MLLLLLFFSQNSYVEGEALCWRCFSSSMYYISTGEKSWSESRQDCRERGADLVTINRGGGEGTWKWVDGTALTTNGEPNSRAGDEDCVMLNDGKWADYPCSSYFIWICEDFSKVIWASLEVQ